MNAPRAKKKYNARQLAAMMADMKVQSKEDYITFFAEWLQAAWMWGQNEIVKAAIVKPLHEYTDAERKKVQTFQVDEDELAKALIPAETLPGEEKNK